MQAQTAPVVERHPPEAPAPYLERDVELDVLHLVSAPNRRPVTLIFQGPRGTGKSTLARRVAEAATNAARTVCSIDVGADFVGVDRVDRDAFLGRLSEILASRLTGTDVSAGADVAATLETYVFPKLPDGTRLTIIIDNIDAIFLTPHALQIYRMFRNFHELGRTSIGPYSEIDWIFTSALELDVQNTLFDINIESPFNIAQAFHLSDLSLDEARELSREFPTWSRTEVDELYDLLGGHPALTRYTLSIGPSVLRRPKASFRDHLDQTRSVFSHDRLAKKALKRLQKSENLQLHAFAKVKQDYRRVAYLLSSAGVLKPKGVGFVIRNGLYRKWL